MKNTPERKYMRKNANGEANRIREKRNKWDVISIFSFENCVAVRVMFAIEEIPFEEVWLYMFYACVLRLCKTFLRRERMECDEH